MHRVQHRARTPLNLLHRREQEFLLIRRARALRTMQLLQNRVALLARRRLARQGLAKALGSRDLLDRLEVLDGLDLQFEGGVFIDDDHGVRVLLQGGEGPHVVDAVFDAFLEGEGFVGAGDDDDDFSGVEDGLHADGEGHAGDGGEVVVEVARVGLQGVKG